MEMKVSRLREILRIRRREAQQPWRKEVNRKSGNKAESPAEIRSHSRLARRITTRLFKEH